MFTQIIRILGAAQVLPSPLQQHALRQTTSENWASFGYGAVTGATAELGARLPDNACVREISEAAGDLYMVARLLLTNDSDNWFEVYASDWFISLVILANNRECEFGGLFPDTETSEETVVTDLESV